MTTQYFKYTEPQHSDVRPSVIIANPDTDPSIAETLIEKTTFRSFISTVILIAGAALLFVGVLTANAGGAFIGFLALIVGLIFSLIASREFKANLRQFNIGHGKTALAISRGHGLLAAGSLLDQEARNIAIVLWETNKAKQDLDSNRPLQDTINAICDEAEARVTERERQVIEQALNVQPQHHYQQPNPNPETNRQTQSATHGDTQPLF